MSRLPNANQGNPRTLRAKFESLVRAIKIKLYQLVNWRRRRDSNPRYELTPYNGLANRRLQPLGHVSGCAICLRCFPARSDAQ